MIDPPRVSLPSQLAWTRLRVIAAGDETPPRSQTGLGVAYLRTAGGGPAALAARRARCQAAADRVGVRIVAEYSDIGSGLSINRPGLRALLDHVGSQPDIDWVVVDQLSSLTRSASTFVLIGDALAAHRVSLVAAH